MKKILVAYFPASGETARLAKTLADVTACRSVSPHGAVFITAAVNKKLVGFVYSLC